MIGVCFNMRIQVTLPLVLHYVSLVVLAFTLYKLKRLSGGCLCLVHVVLEKCMKLPGSCFNSLSSKE